MCLGTVRTSAWEDCSLFMKTSFRQRATVVVLVFYWLTILILAHIPIPQLVYQAQVSDKSLHFLAYLLLAFLFWCSISPDKKATVSSKAPWLALLILGVYGGIDEKIQPYFGRTCDALDFFANIGGILCGLVICALASFWPAFLTVTAVTIFGLANLAKADITRLMPVANTLYHLVVYALLTAIWTRVAGIYLPQATTRSRLLVDILPPLVFLGAVKAASLALGKHSGPLEVALAVAGILLAGAVPNIIQSERRRPFAVVDKPASRE